MVSNKRKIKRITSKTNFREKFESSVSKNCFNNKLKIKDIADELAICQRQLCRNTKDIFDTTPALYIRKFRLSCAVGLLLQGYPIGMINTEVGFSSYSYFARCFKQEYGCTVREFIIREQASQVA